MLNIDELKAKITQLSNKQKQRIDELLMNDPIVQNISGQLTVLMEIVNQLESENEKN